MLIALEFDAVAKYPIATELPELAVAPAPIATASSPEATGLVSVGAIFSA